MTAEELESQIEGVWKDTLTRESFVVNLADFILANFSPKGGQESVEKAATNYANSHWNILNNPNEHDNAFSDFKAGAQWALANTPKGEAEKVTAKECYRDFLQNTFLDPRRGTSLFNQLAANAHRAAKAFNEYKPE